MYDVIIVGARCAGASLASFLGRRGHSVLLVDQFPYPNATTSTHILGESDVYGRLGILGKMESAGAPFLTRMRVDLEGTVFESDITVTKRALGLRRELLDPLLLQSAARHRNVEVRLNTRVTKILLENGRAVGIECRKKDGQLQRFAGKVVIGADGRYSAVAKGVRAPLETETERPLHGVAYAYLSGVHRLPVPAVEWYWKGSSVVLCNPIDGLMHCAAIMYSPEEQERMARLGRGDSWKGCWKSARWRRDWRRADWKEASGEFLRLKALSVKLTAADGRWREMPELFCTRWPASESTTPYVRPKSWRTSCMLFSQARRNGKKRCGAMKSSATTGFIRSTGIRWLRWKRPATP